MTRLPTKTYGNCLLGLHCSQNDPIQSRIPAGQRVVAGRQQIHCQQVIHRLLLTSSAIRGPLRSFRDDLSYPDQQWRAQPLDCSQIPTRSTRVINSNCARKRLARCATSRCIFCNKKSRKPFWRLRDRFKRFFANQPGLITCWGESARTERHRHGVPAHSRVGTFPI